MSDITYTYSLDRNGFRLNVWGQRGTKVAGMYLESPVPYQTPDAFRRDFAVDVQRAHDGIAGILTRP